MKKLLFTVGMYASFMLSPDANDAPADKPAAPPLESEKLTELKAKLVAQDAQLTAATDFDSRMKVMGEMMATQGAIATEEAAIKKANVEAAKKAIADKKLALVTDFETAVIADYVVQSDKKATDEAKAESAAKLTVLRDGLGNEVLGAVKAPAAGTSAPSAGGKGDTAKKIIAAYLAGIASGLDSAAAKKAIIADPYDNITTFSRGTVGAEVKKYLDANPAS